MESDETMPSACIRVGAYYRMYNGLLAHITGALENGHVEGKAEFEGPLVWNERGKVIRDCNASLLAGKAKEDGAPSVPFELSGTSDPHDLLLTEEVPEPPLSTWNVQAVLYVTLHVPARCAGDAHDRAQEVFPPEIAQKGERILVLLLPADIQISDVKRVWWM